MFSMQGDDLEVNTLLIWCSWSRQGVTVCVRMQHVLGNGPGLDARGILHEHRGDCSSLLISIPFFLLLDQPAFESGPVKGFFILHAQRFGTEGLLSHIV